MRIKDICDDAFYIMTRGAFVLFLCMSSIFLPTPDYRELTSQLLLALSQLVLAAVLTWSVCSVQGPLIKSWDDVICLADEVDVNPTISIIAGAANFLIVNVLFQCVGVLGELAADHPIVVKALLMFVSIMGFFVAYAAALVVHGDIMEKRN